MPRRLLGMAQIVGVVGALLVNMTTKAQTVIQAGTTTVALTSADTQNGVLPAHEWATCNAAKTHDLLSFAQGKFGAEVAVDVAHGFTTRSNLRFAKAGSPVYGVIEYRLTIFPLSYRARRNVGATAALAICEFPAFSQLSFSRLMVRWNPSDKLISEYGVDTQGSVYLTTARKGESVFRSAMAVLSQVNPVAYRSLDSILGASARSSCFASLSFLFDMRGAVPIGQPELNLTSALIADSILANEFTSGYVSGTLDTALRPTPQDNSIVVAIKNLLKDALKSLASKAGSAIWNWISGWLGSVPGWFGF